MGVPAASAPVAPSAMAQGHPTAPKPPMKGSTKALIASACLVGLCGFCGFLAALGNPGKRPAKQGAAAGSRDDEIDPCADEAVRDSLTLRACDPADPCGANPSSVDERLTTQDAQSRHRDRPPRGLRDPAKARSRRCGDLRDDRQAQRADRVHPEHAHRRLQEQVRAGRRARGHEANPAPAFKTPSARPEVRPGPCKRQLPLLRRHEIAELRVRRTKAGVLLAPWRSLWVLARRRGLADPIPVIEA